MLQKKVIVSLLSLSTILAVPQIISASSRTNYVHLKTSAKRVTFYHRIPTNKRQSRKNKRITVNPMQVFKVQRRQIVDGHVYLDLTSSKTSGWVKQSATVQLQPNHKLAVYRQQSLNDQITGTPRALTLTLNGPQAISKDTQLQRLTIPQVNSRHLRITQKVWTDLGQYYKVTGTNGLVGWISVTKLTVQPITATLTPITRKAPVKRPTVTTSQPVKASPVLTSKKTMITQPKTKNTQRGTAQPVTHKVGTKVTNPTGTTSTHKFSTNHTADTTSKTIKKVVKPTTGATSKGVAKKSIKIVNSNGSTKRPTRIVSKPQNNATASGIKVTAKQPTATKVTINKAPTSTSKRPTPTTPVQNTHPKTSTPVVKKSTATTKPAVTSQKLTAIQALTKINALINDNHFMGTMLITNDGPAGIKTFSYGDANVTNKIANTNNEVYPLASLEKALTGAVIQRLINQGKLTMNTPLSQFYPQIPYANSITIRQLLNHTSGIRMSEPVPNTALTTEPAEVNFTIDHLKSTNQHVWSYSNANFTLLSGIVNKVTGKSFMSNLETDVLKPLGMKHTFLYNQVPNNVLKPLSYTYRNGVSRPDPISTNLLSSELGCGNIYASVGDYYTFIHSLVTGKLDTKTGFLTLADNLEPKYSGGIYYRNNGTLRIGGSDNSFHSYLVGSDNGNVAVTLFVNQGSWTVGNKIDEQIEQILSQAELL